MTCNTVRANRLLPATRRRTGAALIGALLLAAGLTAGASPASAACTGTTVQQADNTARGRWEYTCRLRCMAYDRPERERVLAVYELIGRTDAMFCRARCAMDHRCRAVGWVDDWSLVDGRWVVRRTCTLYGNGDFATVDSTPGSSGVDTHVLCILDRWGTMKPHPRDTDITIDPRDSYRPGVPGPGGAPLKR